MTRGIFGLNEGWHCSRSIFLRGLAFIYFIAFLSFGVQASGLVGSQGILPASEYLQRVHEILGGESFVAVPTLYWLDPSDWLLSALWIAGIVSSILLLIGLLPRVFLCANWVLYLSIYSIGQDFLSFQWDILLLETGFIGILYAPSSLRLDSKDARAPSTVARLLVWWLLLRLMFMSGLVKLLSGDPAWHSGVALEYHWYTQPLPTWASWYAEGMPRWTDDVGVWWMYLAELGLPWLVFAGRIPRRIAVIGMVLFQVQIAATGNYGFFNLLTIVLCLSAIDDRAWFRPVHSQRARPASIGWRTACVLAAIVIVPSSIVLAWRDGTSTARRPNLAPPHFLLQLAAWPSRFGIVNTYGLFRVMTTSRPEIVIESSEDGITWKPYVFKYKPGPLGRRPSFVAPHMPRLDWQMWFAALRGRPPSWFGSFALRLLEGSEPVLELLESAPEGTDPPKFIRARLHDYTFTDAQERADSSDWWKEEELGIYLAPVRLRAP